MNKIDSKAEFIRQLKTLAKEGRGKKEFVDLFDKIIKGEIRLADTQIVSTVDGGGIDTIKLFKTDDSKIPGLRSIAQSKLPKGSFILVDRIQVLAVTLGLAYTPALAAAANFDTISGIAGLPTGWLNISANKKPVISELPNQSFVTDENTSVNRGTYYLDNPFMLTEEELLEANIELQEAAAANTAVKIVLGGTGTIPA